MFKINLVPEVQKKKTETKRRNLLATMSAVIILSVVVVALLILGGINVVKKQELTNTNKRIAETNKEIEQYKELEETVLSLEKGLQGAKQALDGSNKWTILLDQMEKLTPSNVSFLSMKMSEDGIDARLESKTMDELAKFVESLKKYQMIVINGTGQAPETTVKISKGGTEVGSALVRSDGSWVIPLNFNPDEEQSLRVDWNGGGADLTYSAKNKTLTATSSSVTGSAKYLFSGIESPNYLRTEKGVYEMTVKFIFDGSAIW